VKKVIKGLFLFNRLIICAEIIVGYIMSLIRSKRLLDFYNTKEFGAIDCDTRKANKIIILLMIVLIVIGTTTTIVVNTKMTPRQQLLETLIIKELIKRILILIVSFLGGVLYLNGLLVLPIRFYYTTSLIITQINELNSGMIKILTNQSIHK